MLLSAFVPPTAPAPDPSSFQHWWEVLLIEGSNREQMHCAILELEREIARLKAKSDTMEWTAADAAYLARAKTRKREIERWLESPSCTNNQQGLELDDQSDA